MMRLINTKSIAALGAVIVVAAVAGCGSGGSSSGAGIDPSASADSFIAYVRLVAAVSSDTSEPRDVAGIVPMTSDTTEPQPL